MLHNNHLKIASGSQNACNQSMCVNSKAANSMDECAKCQLDGALHKENKWSTPKIASGMSPHVCHYPPR